MPLRISDDLTSGVLLGSIRFVMQNTGWAFFLAAG